ncbi:MULTISPECIES: nuclear transport factor 2-like protein [Sphingobacterium]|uniref:Nuclear transport factor 2 family protein n=1 Tax=Sphingobacterium populi TaxID=1812824 RepID=A0ABW5UF32_9SPHI|nr:hypothetical protein [Sphingobacterium sp. CFCC 11742]
MKLTVPDDCDNSPRRRILRDLLKKWYTADWDNLSAMLHDDFTFRLVEQSRTIFKEDLKSYLSSGNHTIHLTIDKILSHGKFGAVKGMVEQSVGKTNFAFFMEFRSAGNDLIHSIVLFNINHEEHVVDRVD